MLQIYSFFYLFSIIIAQSTINEFCYKNVKTELDDILERYKNIPNFTPPNEFPKIRELIDKSKDINSQIKRHNKDLVTKLNNTDARLNSTRYELESIGEGENIIKDIDNANKLKKVATSTNAECSKAEENFKKFKKDFDELHKRLESFNETFGKLILNINNTNKKSSEMMRSLEKINIPSYLGDQYMCDMNIFKTFNGTLHIARKIKKILKNLRDKFLSDVKDIKKNLDASNFDQLDKPPLTVKKLKKYIKYFKEENEEILELKDLIEKKNKAKTTLVYIKEKAVHLCRKKVCKLERETRVET